MKKTFKYPLIWAQIDLDAISHNIRELRNITNKQSILMAVVKANGYGHGAVEVARIALENGAEALAVARIGEAIELRNAGLNSPILIFSYTPINDAQKLVHFDLTQTVYTYEAARAYSEIASGLGKDLKIHIKIDTGMGRLGMIPDFQEIGTHDENLLYKDTQKDIEAIFKLPSLIVEGIFTHFSSADSEDKSFAQKQLDRFLGLLERLRLKGFEFPLCHAANSAAIIDIPSSHMDMVRPGISIYGLYPSSNVNKDKIHLKPAMTLKSKVIQKKDVPAGFNVSYGNTYQTNKPTTVATIPAGYADGFNRLFSSKGQMLVHGKRAPVIGRVCMDHTMLDVGHIPDVEVEDEVVIFGEQESQLLHIDEVAKRLSTINYEIVTTITNRVPRVYIDLGEKLTS